MSETTDQIKLLRELAIKLHKKFVNNIRKNKLQKLNDKLC